MELDYDFVKSKYSIEDLEQFRDGSGFIDLTKAGINFSDESREIIGNPNRVKNWVDFNGKKVLIKGEIILEEEKNYGIYAELIVEEIAKKKGIETAHYDLIKMLNEDGKEIYGVLSESVVNRNKGEFLVSLHSIIGDEPEETAEFVDITGIEYTINELRKNLLLDGYDDEQIENVINDYKKRLAFTLSIIDTDKHTENVAFIKEKVDGRNLIRISPNFDSESSLMLDNDISTIEKLLGDYEALKESVDFADPKIGVFKSAEEGGFESLWKDTLEELCSDDEIYDYCADVLKQPINMDEVLDVNEIDQYKYTPNEEAVKSIKDEVSLIHEMLEGSEWRDPIPFFKERIDNAQRFSSDVISYHTDFFKMVKTD